MDVHELITAATAPEHQDQTARQQAVTALLTQHSGTDLAALESAAVTAWNTANGELDPATAQPDAVTAHTDRMTRLGDVVLAIRSHRTAAAAQQPQQPEGQQPQQPTPQQAAQQTAPAANADPATAQPATTTPEQPPASPGAPVSAPPAQQPGTPQAPAEQPPAEQPSTPQQPAQQPPAEQPTTPAADPVPAATPPAEQPPATPAGPPPATDVPAAPAGAPPDSSTTTPPAVQQEVAVSQTPAPAAPAAGAAVVPAVAASAAPPAPAVFDWAGMPFDTVVAGAGGGDGTGEGNANGYAITASSGVPRYNLGQNLGVEQLADAFLARMDQLGRGLTEPMPHVVASASGADWNRAYSAISRHGVATLALPAAARTHVMRDIRDDDTIERACNEHLLPGGSLTAAVVAGTPGWCAPAEQRFEFCPPEVADQLLDLPTVIAPRGAVQYPIEPDFSAVYSTPNLGWCYPAEAYQNPAAPDPAVPGPLNKPCIDVPCPDNESIVLDPCGLCVRARILLATAYPEAVQKFLARVLVAWAIRQNARNVASVVNAADAITVPAGLVGPGTTATVLEVVEFYNTWLRYRHSLGQAATMEAVFPLWMRGPMRADLSKRQGGNGDMMDVTDQQLDAWLLRRGVRPQWIRGLDEAYNDPAQTNPNINTSLLFAGGVDAPGTTANPFGVNAGTLWPTTGRFLMYPAGSFVRFRLGLVNLEGGLIDSALLGRNERLLMFVEEANKTARRCYQALSIRVPICPTGQTGGVGTTPLCGQPVETP